jgi:hypothetical protein
MPAILHSMPLECVHALIYSVPLFVAVSTRCREAVPSNGDGGVVWGEEGYENGGGHGGSAEGLGLVDPDLKSTGGSVTSGESEAAVLSRYDTGGEGGGGMLPPLSPLRQSSGEATAPAPQPYQGSEGDTDLVDIEDISVRCMFCDRNFHSRMPLVPTPARLKLLHACDPAAFLSGGHCLLPLPPLIMSQH